MRKLLTALLFTLLPALAYAQTGNEFDTPTSGKKTVGTVTMCLNASGLAVPTASGQCANTQPVADANVGAPGATACTTDTASCVLNAQIQRLLIRIGDLITVAGTPAKICDNVSCDSSHTVDVLPASTAAAVTHMPMVVAQHPSSPTPAQASAFPFGAIPVMASPANGTTAGLDGALAASTTLKTYICGFAVRANATTATNANITVTGLSTTLNFLEWVAPVGSGLGISEQVFMPCLPSSAVNTAVHVISGAPGAGGANSLSAWGYQAP